MNTIDKSIFNNILNDIDIVFFSLDLNYCYTSFSKKHSNIMKKIWNIDIELGKSMLTYITNEKDREKAKVNFDKVLQGETLIIEEDYGSENLLEHYGGIGILQYMSKIKLLVYQFI